MNILLTYLRKVIPHNSPVRLWYTRLQQVAASILLPVDTRHIKLIGVTGTDGKTTTVEMLAHMLHELDIPSLSTSSVAASINGTVLSASKRTTPSLWQLRKLLRRAIQEKVEVAVLEVSSHALVQWRILGIQFDTVLLTNITHEHLNYHKTIECYSAAKKLLFTKHLKLNGKMLLPTNDAYGKKWLAEYGTSALPYSPENSNAVTDKYGTTFVHNNQQYTMPMLGSYNAGNAIAAALAIASLNITSQEKGLITTGTALCTLCNLAGVPGRMQLVPADTITALVDFALTEKAMQSALATAREIAQSAKVILVFGASGGQHDATVHPGLAQAAALGANIAIVTDDEPYDGDPAKIRTTLINSIKGAGTDCEYYDIADRRAAIAKALSLANDGDVVIVTGMGHYTSRTIDGAEVPWNDAEALAKELERIRT